MSDDADGEVEVLTMSGTERCKHCGGYMVTFEAAEQLCWNTYDCEAGTDPDVGPSAAHVDEEMARLREERNRFEGFAFDLWIGVRFAISDCSDESMLKRLRRLVEPPEDGWSGGMKRLQELEEENERLREDRDEAKTEAGCLRSSLANAMAVAYAIATNTSNSETFSEGQARWKLGIVNMLASGLCSADKDE